MWQSPKRSLFKRSYNGSDNSHISPEASKLGVLGWTITLVVKLVELHRLRWLEGTFPHTPEITSAAFWISTDHVIQILGYLLHYHDRVCLFWFMCNDLPNFKSIFFALYKWDWEECAHCCWRKVTGFCFDEHLHTLSEWNPISTNQKYKHARERTIKDKFCTLIHHYLSSWICLIFPGKIFLKSQR